MKIIKSNKTFAADFIKEKEESILKILIQRILQTIKNSGGQFLLFSPITKTKVIKLTLIADDQPVTSSVDIANIFSDFYEKAVQSLEIERYETIGQLASYQLLQKFLNKSRKDKLPLLWITPIKVSLQV